MIEYIIIGLLIIVIILIIILLLKGDNHLIEKVGKLELNTVKELSTFRNDLSRDLTEDFDKLQDRIEKRLILINDSHTPLHSNRQYSKCFICINSLNPYDSLNPYNPVLQMRKLKFKDFAQVIFPKLVHGRSKT